MAGHLNASNHSVYAWNRTNQRLQEWAHVFGGQITNSIEDAVKNADIVCLCVGNDNDVYEVVGEVLRHMPKGGLIIDHTTASAKCATACDQKAKAKGIGFLDAPISGGEAGAQNGQLTIMCGGDEADFERARPVMQTYGRAMTFMGESGSGQLTKMVNQICIAGVLQGLSEGINFAMKAGLDVEQVIQAIGKGAAQSWQMENRALTMARGEFDFGFAVDWMRKDLAIALDAGEAIGADLTLTKLVDSYYSDIQAMGGARQDTSSLIRRLSKS